MAGGGSFDDPTMVRYKLAIDIAREFLGDIPWVTAAEFVDVYFNGRFHGVYILLEHVREDNNRVSVSSSDFGYGNPDKGFLIEHCARANPAARPGVAPAWNNGGNRTGIEYFRINPFNPSALSGQPPIMPASNDSRFMMHPFEVIYPDSSDIGSTVGGVYVTGQVFRNQIEFVREYVERVHAAAFRRDFAEFSRLADVGSFVDMYILQELSMNTDAGFSSFNLSRRPGGKLYANAPWDFDATAGLSRGGQGAPFGGGRQGGYIRPGYSGIYVAGRVRNAHYGLTASRLLFELYHTPEFRRLVNARWQEISPGIRAFVNERLSDDFISEYRVAFGRNLHRWENHTMTVAGAENRWETQTRFVRTWYLNRIGWFDRVWVVGNYNFDTPPG